MTKTFKQFRFFSNLLLYYTNCLKTVEDAKVQTAKGVMFSSLDDVAKHLQSLGVKVRGPMVLK